MAQLYRKYIRLLNKWPVDKTKAEDLGQHIRDQIKIAFTKGETSKVLNQELCEKNYESLDKIASNYYTKKYPVNLKKTATGLTKEVCAAALSKDGQKLLSETKLGFFDKLTRSIKRAIYKEQIPQ